MEERLLEMKRPLWEVFSEFTKAVTNAYQEQNKTGHGHGFMHGLMVAQYGPMFAEEKWVGVLAWIAGLIHDMDWIFSDKIEKRILGYLSLIKGITIQEKRFIFEAIMHHGEKNKDTDNPVTRVLKDADRLGNIGVICPLRTGQAGFELPLFNAQRSKTANYRNVETLRDSMRITLEWVPMLRCRKAIKYAQRHIAYHQAMIKELEDLIKATGIDKFSHPF